MKEMKMFSKVCQGCHLWGIKTSDLLRKYSTQLVGGLEEKLYTVLENFVQSL